MQFWKKKFQIFFWECKKKWKYQVLFKKQNHRKVLQIYWIWIPQSIFWKNIGKCGQQVKTKIFVSFFVKKPLNHENTCILQFSEKKNIAEKFHDDFKCSQLFGFFEIFLGNLSEYLIHFRLWVRNPLLSKKFIAENRKILCHTLVRMLYYHNNQ
jgi:hypothetical protein